LEPVRHDDLCRCRRGRRTHIRGEIGQGHVHLMADPADDRQRVRDDRAYDTLVVERPEVLERSTATCEDGQGWRIVRPAGLMHRRCIAPYPTERRYDAGGGGISLDLWLDEHA